MPSALPSADHCSLFHFLVSARVISVSLVPSVIFAHDEAISKQTPRPTRHTTLRPPRDRPARPTTLTPLHLHLTEQKEQQSTAQHSKAPKLDRHEGGAVAAVPAAPNTAE